jgi:hypothetical protein
VSMGKKGRIGLKVALCVARVYGVRLAPVYPGYIQE